MGNDKIKGTLTEQNLINSFAGESQARNRYDYFAKVAQKEGYEQIAAIFNLFDSSPALGEEVPIYSTGLNYSCCVTQFY